MRFNKKGLILGAVGALFLGVAGCAGVAGLGGEGVHGSSAEYEQALSPAARTIRNNLYSSIMLQGLASTTRTGHGSGKQNIGALNTYRRTASPKAFAACIFWDSATGSRVRIDRWQFIHEDPDPKRDAIRRCQPHERPGCRCQIVDISDQNKLYVPPAVLRKLTAK